MTVASGIGPLSKSCAQAGDLQRETLEDVGERGEKHTLCDAGMNRRS